MVPTPAKTTVPAVLDRHDPVTRKNRRRYKAEGTPLSITHKPAGLWCTDYKGEFLLGNKHYCYPLTIANYRSRYLLACEGLTCNKGKYARSVFERVFKDYGLPDAIRTDNGPPFSAEPLLIKMWGFVKSLTTYGWSASCTMI